MVAASLINSFITYLCPANPNSDNDYKANLSLAMPTVAAKKQPQCLDISELTSGGGINGGIVNYPLHWPALGPP